jgi:hypothetical protein
VVFLGLPDFQDVESLVPDLDLTSTILTRGNQAFKPIVAKRMILDLDSEPLDTRLNRWTFRDSPTLQHTIKL